MIPTQQIDRRHFLGFLSAAAGSAALVWTPSKALGAYELAEEPILTWQQHTGGYRTIVDLDTGGNVLSVPSGDSVLLVDSKFAHLGRALLKDAQGFGAEDARVIFVNTHHHGDHTGGNGSIVPHASESYAHANALPRIQDSFARVKSNARKATESVPEEFEELAKSAKRTERAAARWTKASVVPQTGVTDERTTVQVGKLSVDLYHFGAGHTDNDLFVHIPEINVMHTGDVVFNGLHPFFDPSAGYNTKGWVNSTQRALKLCDESTTVIPGHGPIGGRELLQTQGDYLEQLIDAVRSEIDSGTSKEDAAKKSWGFMKGLGFEGIRSRAIESVYDELSD